MAAQRSITNSLEEEEYRALRLKQLWEEFFSDPSQWWDYTIDKKNPRFPDFKHKSAKKALWIDNSFNPSWIHERLAAIAEYQEQGQSVILKPEISGRVARIEQLWQDFSADPSQWWNNRLVKRSSAYPDFLMSAYPDFQHKSTLEGLWIDSWWNPPWVRAKIATMALGQMQFGDGVSDPFRIGADVNKFCEEGRFKDALHIVELMVQQNIQASIDTYARLLQHCTRRKSLAEGKQVHALIGQSGLISDTYLGNLLVDMYAKCGSVVDACKAFNEMPEHNVFSWTAIISACADCGQGEEAVNLFQQTQHTGIALDKVVCVVALRACARIAALEPGRQLHSKMKVGLNQ